MRKKLLATLLSASLALGLVACGSGTSQSATDVDTSNVNTAEAVEETVADSTGEAEADSADETEEEAVEVRDVKLTIWSPSEDQDPENGEWIVTLCDSFNEAHPEWNITYEYGVYSESEVKKALPQDIEAGADVFIYGSSGLENLVSAGAIAEIGGAYLESIKSDYNEVLSELVTYEDGGIYGFPMTTDSYFMYYDKSVFSENDVKNLDEMLTKGTVSIALSNGFYLGAFFTGSGAQFFRDANDTTFDRSVGIILNKDSNLAMANYLVDLAGNKSFVNAEPADAISMMQEGTVNALWSGTWSKADVEAVLGDNMGVAILPTATVDGEDVQLRPYASAKAIGVKSTCENPDVAMALAAYLSSEEAQRLHFELRGYVPSLNTLLSDPVILADDIVAVDAESYAKIAYPRPCYSEFSYYWTPAQSFGEGLRDGVITHDNVKEKLDELNVAVNTPS